MKRIIKIDTEPNTWSYLYPDEWKGFIYGPEEEFDNVFVIVAPSDFNRSTDASWYQKAIEYLEENDIPNNETEVMKALKKLYPDDEFDTFDITGYVQGEYATVIYKVNGSEFPDGFKECFGDFYFGYVTEFIDEEENVHNFIADSEFWEHEDKDLRDFVCDIFNIDPDEDIEIMKSNGYTMVKNWEVVR